MALSADEQAMLAAYRDMRQQMPDDGAVAMLMQIIPVSRHLIDTPDTRAAVELACRRGASRAMVDYIAQQAIKATVRPGPPATTDGDS